MRDLTWIYLLVASVWIGANIFCFVKFKIHKVIIIVCFFGLPILTLFGLYNLTGAGSKYIPVNVPNGLTKGALQLAFKETMKKENLQILLEKNKLIEKITQKDIEKMLIIGEIDGTQKIFTVELYTGNTWKSKRDAMFKIADILGGDIEKRIFNSTP
ncbi:MAG: hypothetical protein COA79_22150 [Planctomycetota bacterium]|nr:MAG: hypothetical protein COA79_22150 [Planctomycetota bacterium]